MSGTTRFQMLGARPSHKMWRHVPARKIRKNNPAKRVEGDTPGRRFCKTNTGCGGGAASLTSTIKLLRSGILSPPRLAAPLRAVSRRGPQAEPEPVDWSETGAMGENRWHNCNSNAEALDWAQDIVRLPTYSANAILEPDGAA